MLTSDNKPGDAGRGKEAGLSGYAVKPVKRADLFRIVCEALKNGRSAAHPRRETDLAQSATKGRPLTILIAEDSPDNQLLVRAYMKETPHELTFVEDGVAAVRAFEADRFDIILMDIQMPLMDGVTATRAIRQRELENGLEPTPIILLSANARAQDVSKSHAAGGTAHLSKPISKGRLLNAIELHAAGSERAAEGSIWVEIPEGLEDLVPEYLRGKRSDLPKMFQMLAASDFERLSISGHNLKGTGSSYGFKELSTIGAALELSAQEMNHEAATRNLQALSSYLGRVKIRSAT